MAGVKLGSAYVNIRARLKPLRAGLAKAMSMVTGAMKKIASIVKKSMQLAVKYIKRLGIAAVAAATFSIYAFAKFEKAMRVATAVSEVTGKQFDTMSKLAREQAIRLNISAKDLAQGFYFLGSAGLSATDQLKAFVPVATLSKAATIDMGQAAEMVVDTMKGFHIGFEKTTHVTDVMAKAVTSSNMTFAQLGTALSKVSGIARTAHNTLEDTATALAVMADVGIKGSLAGTHLKMAIARLMAPMSEAQKVMKKWGITIYDTRTGQMKPFIQIIGELNDALKDATEKQKNFAFKSLFGRRAIVGQIAIMDKGAAAMEAFRDSLKDAGGTAQTIAEKQLKALAERFGQLRKLLTDTAIEFGKALGPALLRFIDDSAVGMEKLNKIVKDNRLAISEWGEVWANRLIMVKKLVTAFAKYLYTDWPDAVKAGTAMVREIFVSFGHQIRLIFEKLWTDVTNMAKNAIQDIGAAMVTAMAKINPKGIGRRDKFVKQKQDEYWKKTGGRWEASHTWKDVKKILETENRRLYSELKKLLPDKLVDTLKPIFEKGMEEEAKIREKYEQIKANKESARFAMSLSGAGGAGGGGGGGGAGGQGATSVGFTGIKDAWMQMARSLTAGGGEKSVVKETVKQTKVMEKMSEKFDDIGEINEKGFKLVAESTGRMFTE